MTLEENVIDFLSEAEHEKWLRWVASRISRSDTTIEMLKEWNPRLCAYPDLDQNGKEIYRKKARELLETILGVYDLDNSPDTDLLLDSAPMKQEEFDKSAGLQETYSPKGVCFGCGPSNPSGLHIKSVPYEDKVVSYWKPDSKYNAFEGILSGGIVSTLLDCHSNFSAAYSLMFYRCQERLTPTVTAEYKVKLKRPTPINSMLYIVSKPVLVTENYVIIYAKIIADGKVTASSLGKFVAVKEEHPAYKRWG